MKRPITRKIPLKIFKHAQNGQFFAAFGANAFHCMMALFIFPSFTIAQKAPSRNWFRLQGKPSQSAAGSTGVVHI